jgi:2-dehydropantoate 2-reductase
MLSDRLCIGVLGAGSVGCYVGGKLLASNTADVILVGRSRLGDEIASHGLTVKDVGRAPPAVPATRVIFETESDALAPCDVVLCCVKSAHTSVVTRSLDDALRPDALVVSLQNGVRNADVLRAGLSGRRVIAGVVSFNVVSRGGGLFHRATSGPLILETEGDSRAGGLVRSLRKAGLEVEERSNLAPDQWTKLLVNLNNAVSALSGIPTRQILLSPRFRRIVAALVDEAVRVLRAGRIQTARFRGVPVGWMPYLLRLPTPLVRLVTAAQLRIDPEARSSMWEDLARGRTTEVDFLNGEIVRLAERVRVDAPFNRRIVKLVHAAERAGTGSPGLDAAALWSKLSGAAL